MFYKLGLNEPSRHALFVNGFLYILTGNVDLPSQTVETGSSIIEDIYRLDLSIISWVPSLLLLQERTRRVERGKGYLLQVEFLVLLPTSH